MILQPLFALTIMVGQDRGFKRSMDQPPSLNVIYLSAFADNHLWASGGRIACLTPQGSVIRQWNFGGSSIAPDGETCWVATKYSSGRIHHLTRHSNFSFDLGKEPVVCRCRSSQDVIALAGGKVWLLNDRKPRNLLKYKEFGDEALLDASTRNELAVCSEDKADEQATLTFYTYGKASSVRVRSTQAYALLRATRDTAFLLARQTHDADHLVLYRIEIRDKRIQIIALLRRDYREILAWDSSTKSLYVNYSDGVSSRIERLTPTGKVLWKSEKFIEFVTGISISSERDEIYCPTKVGPIFVLGR